MVTWPVQSTCARFPHKDLCSRLAQMRCTMAMLHVIHNHTHQTTPDADCGASHTVRRSMETLPLELHEAILVRFVSFSRLISHLRMLHVWAYSVARHGSPQLRSYFLCEFHASGESLHLHIFLVREARSERRISHLIGRNIVNSFVIALISSKVRFSALARVCRMI
jgi:hypothetical protein